ncbi:MAG: alpha-E domain-containing protein [Opitutaceae bacterium]
MLSRVANLVYWTARYVERAQNAARLIDVNAQLVIDLNGNRNLDRANDWIPMIHALGDEKLFSSLYPECNEESVVNFVIFEARNPTSILSCINYARENARCIRDQISSEAWEQLNRIYLRLQNESFANYSRLGAYEYLNRIKGSLILFNGIVDSMFPRNEAWHFYQAGMFLERADNTSRLIDVKYFALLPSVSLVGTAIDTIQWASVLRSCSAFEAFRKSRRGQITPSRVIDYLFLEPSFPRSIRFCISEADNVVRWISRNADHQFTNNPTRSLGRLRANLDYATVREIIDYGPHEYIDALQLKLAAIGNEIETTFFNYELESAPVLA